MNLSISIWSKKHPSTNIAGICVFLSTYKWLPSFAPLFLKLNELAILLDTLVANDFEPATVE